jgi:hypothetical protein
MIELNIIDSPDVDINNKYTFKKRYLSFGSATENCIIIDDPYLSDQHFTIVQTHCAIIGKFNNQAGPTYLNSKRVSGIMVLKPMDVIKAGNTTIKIIKFIPEELYNRQEFLNNKCTEIFNNDQLLTDLLIELNRITTFYLEKSNA